jgi:hypothetical protein
MPVQNKISGVGLRLQHAVRWWPRRWRRLGRHIGHFCWSDPFWWLESLYLMLDILALPELYETLTDWVKWNSRPLRPDEIALLQPIFGSTIDYDRVRIDERAVLGPPQWRICYVSFYTINAWGSMTPALLIHEMVHVWQFQQLGSVYIPRALRAQRSTAGYNYGGAPQVVNWARREARLTGFQPGATSRSRGRLLAPDARLSTPVGTGRTRPIFLFTCTLWAKSLLAHDALILARGCGQAMCGRINHQDFQFQILE